MACGRGLPESRPARLQAARRVARGRGVNDEDAHVYSEALRRGGTIVMARIEAGRYEDAQAILAQSRAVDIAKRGKSTWNPAGAASMNPPPSRAGRDRARARPSWRDGAAAVQSTDRSSRVEGTAFMTGTARISGRFKRLMIDK